MIFDTVPAQTKLEQAITNAYRLDETLALNALIPEAIFDEAAQLRIKKITAQLITNTRAARKKLSTIDTFLAKYDLSSDEGIALMCLAEALLRIPDTTTIDRLISDKISTADWQKHFSMSDSLFVNAATWSLLLTGKIYAGNLHHQKTLGSSLKRLIARAGGLVIRPAVMQSMKIIGKQFVMGRTIDEAIKRAQKLEAIGYRYSYDMLGEAAKTAEDADRYFKSYEDAVRAIGQVSKDQGPIQSPGISIKLSALHPRYELGQRQRVLDELIPRLLTLVQQAKACNIGLTIDAEESERLELSLEIFKIIYQHPSLSGWEGFGLAVQSYQKRAPFVLDWLTDLAKTHDRKIMVRLIKGAYWDAEIKQAQVLGLDAYPVFTRKHATDVSFIACAKKLLSRRQYFYPQFGTHNAYCVAAILEMAGTERNFEFQCLHGMGQPLYNNIINDKNLNISCRIYAPVGSHKDLLGYLVRRLLENGANTSFINQLADETSSVENLMVDPATRIKNLTQKAHPHIPLPKNIFGSSRINSQGFDFSNLHALTGLKNGLDKLKDTQWKAMSIIAGKNQTSTLHRIIHAPAQLDEVIGEVWEATPELVENALQVATKGQEAWEHTSVNERANLLEKTADLLEKSSERLIHLLCLEAGKQLVDCVSEIREAVDFCRYYAVEARRELTPRPLVGPTGEYDQFSLHARGVIVCISPWNFPLAIFLGQIAAALVCGNTVIAKPAEQTPLIAVEVVNIMLAAGIPADALQLLPGDGATIGGLLVADQRVAGIMFTGSTQTARIINQTLAQRPGPITPLIAETGGQNAMIVDSSALPEQVVTDILHSAFNSAGQRCSALRVIYVQEDIAPRVIDVLTGAMAELTIGDPSLLSTDVGPVIDPDALKMLEKHFERMSKEGNLIYQMKLPEHLKGYYFAPCVFQIDHSNILEKEVFGPFLHIITFKAQNLDQVLAEIQATGYGLTLGVHSRIDSTIEYITNNVTVGNLYVNRNMIGAVVGVQPFGGEGLSGTGPKAGGPFYLPRLCVERSISVNTSAAGGNTTLISLNEDD